MTIHAEESVPAPDWDEGPPSPATPSPTRGRPLPAPRLATPEDSDDEPTEVPRRTMPRRFTDAFPLVAASLACAAVGWIVRQQESATPSREFPIWGLFVALAIIAGMGALISFMIDEDEPSPAGPRERRRPVRRVTVMAESETPSVEELLDDLESSPRLPAPAGAPTRTTTAARRPLEARAAPRSRPERHAEVEVDLEGLESPGPAEAIAEIDILWSDLERIRRERAHGRRPHGA